MLLITSECRIPAGLTRISPSTSSYLLPSLGVFRRSWRVAGTLVVIIVIVMPPPFHRLGTLHVHFPGEAYNGDAPDRSEEHTSELQSQSNLVCRLLLEKKKNT